MRQHNLSRLWLVCWDCRLAQKAWAAGEFYTHDEPRWYFDECMQRAEPVEIIAPPAGPNITVWPDGTVSSTPQTTGSGTPRVWLHGRP